MRVSSLEFLRVTDPNILVQNAKKQDNTLFVEPCAVLHLRHVEGKRVKARARNFNLYAEWSPKRKVWVIYTK